MVYPTALVMTEGIAPLVLVGADPGAGVDLRTIEPGFAGAIGKYLQLLTFHPVPFPRNDLRIKPFLICTNLHFGNRNLFFINNPDTRTNCHGVKTPNTRN